jgi:DNA-binding PadR family transcriptional regulator
MTDTRPDRLTTTEHALLGMLARYGEHSGYELLKLAEGGIGFFWSPAKSHVYEVLPRLERGGHVRRRLVPQSGRPDKHLWRITPRGRATLRRWLNTIDPNPLEERGQFLLKVFFGEHGDPGRLVAHLERFRDQAERKLETLRALDAEQPDLGTADLPRMTLRQGLAGTEAQLRWAEEILPELRDWAGSRGGRQVPSGAGGCGT